MGNVLRKVAPSLDLGELLEIIRNEYDGIGLGFSLENPFEVAMLMENSQVKARILKEANYSMKMSVVGLPQVSKKENAKPNLNYRIYQLVVNDKKKEELLSDRAKLLRTAINDINDSYFGSVVFVKDDLIHILINSADDEGGRFTEEHEAKLIKIICE